MSKKPFSERALASMGSNATYLLIRDLWDEGRTVFEIGTTTDMSPTSVSGIVGRLRRAFGWCQPRERGRPFRAPAGTPRAKLKVSLPTGLHLHARMKGAVFRAEVVAGGFRDEDGEIHSSLSAAAVAVVKRKFIKHRILNGHDFWRVWLRDGRECVVETLSQVPEMLGQVSMSGAPMRDAEPARSPRPLQREFDPARATLLLLRAKLLAGDWGTSACVKAIDNALAGKMNGQEVFIVADSPAILGVFAERPDAEAALEIERGRRSGSLNPANSSQAEVAEPVQPLSVSIFPMPVQYTRMSALPPPEAGS